MLHLIRVVRRTFYDCKRWNIPLYQNYKTNYEFKKGHGVDCGK
jgi:hypothetical protein